MKRLFLIIIIFFFGSVSGQRKEFFIFKESEVYSLFNFMETAAKMPGTSSTYRKFITEKLADNKDFQKLVQDFKSIDYNESISRQDYPAGRNYRKSYLTLLVVTTLKSKDLEDFNERITGILPINEQMKIYNSLKNAQPYFRQFVWNESEAKIKRQISELKKYNDISSELFLKFNHFYKSSWDVQVPFYVTLYPIPGKQGNTTATPHGNALCVGSMTDSNDTIGTLGVTLHEMCHILYNEQSKEVQAELEKYFTENKSRYSKLAYSYFNEAMATALGNGYGYKILNKGNVDKGEWYNKPTINLFAKAIYPLTEKYLEQNKPIDKNFVDEIIKSFEKTFPNSIYEYGPNFNTLNLYADQIDGNVIFDSFFKYFSANSVHVSSPLKDVSQSHRLLEDDSSFIILLDKDQKENLEELKKAFPEIQKIKYDSTINNISFFDAKNRMIVILFINKPQDLDQAFEKLEKHKQLDKNKLIQY
ncbi:hypothetical protein [Chryseobacterium polytrichastri]|uniref:Uncharacterized protein n=1 Tax=Chryseobacterium polytrichastri TaxID=1302687 RepID=A0A1M6U6R0_9FLAO|nr:hypothetical protein [Chryseobacterium polytrichastri]SHK64841.1 hypothetical protein SAMN05444267_100662 [Chryseobacterium polytrichastri]